MIIGKDKIENLSNQSFNTKMNMIKENSNNYHPIQESINPMQHSNVLSKNEMHEKSFQMLQDRFQKGLISLEDFNKKCKELSKK